MHQQPLLFDIQNENARLPRPVNVACVPQRSPFRYPGGKTWLVPLFRRWIQSMAEIPEYLIEPFAGGGIISLTAICENLVQRVLMVELDGQIAAVWKAIVEGDGEWLARRIISFEMNRKNAIAEIQTKRKSNREIAFQTIIKNRTFHGGILAEGSGFLKNGENGKGILSRWYPQTIAKRIRSLSMVAGKIDFIQGDGLKVLMANAKNRDAIFFIDPPYTAGGKRAGNRLYNCFELDHNRLFEICGTLEGDFLMTYDNAEEVKGLARRHGFQMKPVAMKNTHHAEMAELLIGRNLDWLSETNRVHEKGPRYSAKWIMSTDKAGIPF